VGDLGIGDLVITEIMHHPAAVKDSVGEWFELLNGRDACVDLLGLVLRSDGEPPHTVAKSVVAAPGGYVVLGRNADPAKNGGIAVSYSYGDALDLRREDVLAVATPAGDLDTTAWQGLFAPHGASRSLDPSCLLPFCNNYEHAFCEAPKLIPGSTDRGSPGRENDPCPP
jgi:hypothetical protein